MTTSGTASGSMATLTLTEGKAAAVEDHTEIMSGLWKSGEHSDLTVVAGEMAFKVHSWVLWPRSKFFDAACHGTFKASRHKSIMKKTMGMFTLIIHQKAIEKRIQLPDDKPKMVERLLSFCYEMEYSDSSDKAAEPGYVSPVHTNAEMYALADKYEMTGLKQAAKTKFLSGMTECLDSNNRNAIPSFPALAALVYTGTPVSDRACRDPVVTYAQKRWESLATKPGFKTVLAENPDFAFDIINTKPLVIRKTITEPVYTERCSSCRSRDNWKPTRVTCSCGRYEYLQPREPPN